jgi:hypothetical protein
VTGKQWISKPITYRDWKRKLSNWNFNFIQIKIRDSRAQKHLEKTGKDQQSSEASEFSKYKAFYYIDKSFIEKALEAERNVHLADTIYKNKRNGKGKKTAKYTNNHTIQILKP